jgi:hypothetical protein
LAKENFLLLITTLEADVVDTEIGC